MTKEPTIRSRLAPILRGWEKVVRGFQSVDCILRQEPFGQSSLLAQNARVPLRKTALIVMLVGPIYGIAMGSYAWVAGERTLFEQIPQAVYSGVKIPLLIFLTVLISLPSFFVINTLLGLRDDFRESLAAIISAQAGMIVILVSFFPLTLFAYVSTSHLEFGYSLAILINAGMFGLASVSAQALLRAYYSPLIAKDARHRWMVRSWIFVYAFVGIQASYVLRPFIGNPKNSISFFRKESLENAYIRVFQLVLDVVQGMLP